MNIKKLELENFTKHQSTSLTFPDAGLVVVSGANGSGKSSIAEGPCVAQWGEMLRGASPWAGDGRVTLTSDVVVVTRKRKGSRTSVEWNVPGTAPVTYETTSKAQEALEVIVGSFDLWRRSRVFSSQDAAHFTLATDGERKRLLEDFLGLGKFDTALDACKEDSKRAAQIEIKHRDRVLRANADRRELAARLEDLSKALLHTVDPDAVDEASLRAKLVQASRFSDDTAREMQGLQADLQKLSKNVGKQEARSEALAKRLSKLAGKSECASCGQSIDPSLEANLRAMIQAENQAIANETNAIVDASARITGQLRELQSDRAGFQSTIQTITAQLNRASVLAEQRAKHEAQAALLRPQLANAVAEESAAEVAYKEARRVSQELEACVAVLGLKGVRAHVLGKSLDGLERVANGWLAKIAGSSISLSLKPYTEKKTGGMSDAISLEVHGAGGGHGYRAASGGERRRIDVSILLALAEVAQAAHGTSKGTIFFDECMDSLDGDGIDRVSEALNELAKDRCVVVITHNPSLAVKLAPVQKWAVDGGTVKVV